LEQIRTGWYTTDKGITERGRGGDEWGKKESDHKSSMDRKRTREWNE